MTTAAIRDKLQDYIRFADDKKVKAIYTILEGEIENEYNWWEDEAFIARLDREMEHLKKGKSKTHTWDEVRTATKRLRTKRHGER